MAGLNAEPALDPDRPIIDPHLHLWDLGAAPGTYAVPTPFLEAEAQAMLAASGHTITHSVYVECGQGYRADGPDDWRCLGETETQAAVAARHAGGTRLNHRIVGTANLLLGDAVRPVLEAHVAAGGERFRGVRQETAWSEAGLFGYPCRPDLRHRLRDPRFVAGAKVLVAMDLSLDVWCVHSQLGELAALVDDVPGLAVVIDHVGTPESGAEARAEWLAAITELARRPNVWLKLGGMGMDITAHFKPPALDLPSTTLAERWRPWIEDGIAAFGASRCMFESNFPPDAVSGSYGATWNAFKRVVDGASDTEKDWLFRRTAAAVYRIALDGDA
ncbi:MAG: amidohydrolase family protein [Sphingomonadales bacterium]|nr:amidohydrolase family protein [Sphingomonadales bacterium]